MLTDNYPAAIMIFALLDAQSGLSEAFMVGKGVARWLPDTLSDPT
jgi:hypothetical protein